MRTRNNIISIIEPEYQSKSLHITSNDSGLMVCVIGYVTSKALGQSSLSFQTFL